MTQGDIHTRCVMSDPEDSPSNDYTSAGLGGLLSTSVNHATQYINYTNNDSSVLTNYTNYTSCITDNGNNLLNSINTPNIIPNRTNQWIIDSFEEKATTKLQVGKHTFTEDDFRTLRAILDTFEDQECTSDFQKEVAKKIAILDVADAMEEIKHAGEKGLYED